MAGRRAPNHPLRDAGVEELERFFSEALPDEGRLRAILAVLKHRTTARARDLRHRIEDHLNAGIFPAADGGGGAPPKPLNPKPDRQFLNEGEYATGGGAKDAPASRPQETKPRSPPPRERRDPPVEPESGPSRAPARPASAKVEHLPGSHGITQLIEYVCKLVELNEKPVWSLSSYNNLILHESELRNHMGIRHDLSDADGAIYLKVDRLRRSNPPEPPASIKDWLTVAPDPSSAPVVQSLHMTVMTTAEAERLIAHGTVERQDVANTLKPRPGEDLKDVTLRLDRFPQVKAQIEAYVADAWSRWAHTEHPRRKTIAIYDRLFSLQQALRLEGSDRPLEVVWGMGIARWRVPPNELDHPLVEQLVELELDENAAVIVRPRGADPIVALKPFAAMDNPGVDRVAAFARDHFAALSAQRDLSPFEKDTFTPVLRYACAQFDRAGRYHRDRAAPENRDVPPAGPDLVVTDTWVVYARPRSDNFFTADLERLRAAVEAAQSLPGPASALVTKPSDKPTYGSSISGPGASFGASQSGLSAATLDRAGGAAEQADVRQLFFPKAFNDEQVAIVERLERAGVDGVVVQGPPGTGKTHTIANIICHYLATGRRVLVTSKSEGALAVLRDQIPDGIRDLAISLLTSERDGLKQLEATVNLLASKIASLDTRRTERDIADAERRIAELERRIANIDAEMRGFAEKHLSDTDGILPIDLAERIVRDREHYTWFADRPAISQKPAVGDADIAAARTSRRALGTDLAYLGAALPSSSDLPDAASLVAIHEDLANAARIERARQPGAPLMCLAEAGALSRAEALLAAVEAVVAVHESGADAPWLANLYGVWRRHGLDAEAVRPLAELLARFAGPVGRRMTIAVHAVGVPDDAHTQIDVVSAVRRAASGRRPFAPIPFGKTAARLAVYSIRILGKRPDGPDEWQKVSEVLAWRCEIAEAIARWNSLAAEFSLPSLPNDPDDAARVLEAQLASVAALYDALLHHVPLVHREVRTLFPYGLSPDAICLEVEHARQAAEAIRSEVSRHRFAGARARLAASIEKLADCSGQISQEIAEFLSVSIGDPEIPASRIADDWMRLKAELDRIRSLRPHLETVTRVAAEIAASGAPQWAECLRSRPVEGSEDEWTPDGWRDAWNWAQADGYLRAIDGRYRLRELDEQRRSADNEMRRLFHDVVRLRTLRTLKERITDRVDAALQMFLTAIRNIGRGTGKRASRLRRDARDAMEISYAAVPCWIMPSWRIAESLPAALGSFDLVIIDEASQADISALPALLRAKKVLIVGDDKQVSPTAAFIEEQTLRSLRMHYLDGQPFGALMLPGNSLYELALACYRGRIMLKEHFRCVEPIIRFSCQFYPEEIIPVRLPKALERLSPPLIDVHVADGRKDKSNRNLAEAEAIVDEVARIVADPKMKERSIGVISLIGNKQAQLIQAMLLQRIGEDAYLRHDIACGDSAVFQGKERDIMLLSMVECPQTCTSKTALPFQQRFNVALSRARDREYLFHSVTAEMLKPDDLKAKVLRHFVNPMQGGMPPDADLMALCDSPFERDVLARLLKLGYRVQPQVRVGPYSIDLVVEGHDDRRLAIELDGDRYHGPERWAEDLARQRVMERVGWRFWRCWGSGFRLDPDGCIADLRRVLDALGIEPIGSDDAPSIWTEFRTVGGQDAGEAAPPDAAAAETGIEQTARFGAESQTVKNAAMVEIGDRAQLLMDDDLRIRVVKLTADRHDPNLGLISARHPSGEALLGAAEDEEIEFEINGEPKHWIVIKIEKEAEFAIA